MSRKTARIQDVARIARVSTATVSRALSHPDKLTDSTRKAVFEAIETTGYRVNRAARNLRQMRANAVLVLVPNLGNPFFSQILAGISDRLSHEDVSVLIAESTHLPERDGALADYFRDGRVDGMISLDGALTDKDIAALSKAGAAERIVFACEWVQGGDIPSVRSDNRRGAELAIRHLHDLGHRRIAHVAGPENNVLSHARRQGMMTACRDLGLAVRPDWMIHGDFSLASGRQAAASICAMAERPSAVFCASDEVAIGLIAGLDAKGIQVPRDISVIGFDDIDLASYYIPALSTVRQDRLQLGRRAADMMLAALAGQALPQPGHVETVDVALVPRASTALHRT